jgi:hypothetical protein
VQTEALYCPLLKVAEVFASRSKTRYEVLEAVEEQHRETAEVVVVVVLVVSGRRG